MNEGGRSPRRLSFYALGFLGLVFVTLLSVAVIGLYTLQGFDAQLRETGERYARREINDALHQLRSQWMSVLRRIAEWDEVRQQLENRVYYPYWRGYRLHGRQDLPPGMEALEIYDAQGVALARLADSGFPYRLPEVLIARKEYLKLHPDGRVWAVQAIPDPHDEDKRLGYVVMRIDPLASLSGLSFRHVLDGSLRLPLIERPMSLGELVQRIEFRLPPAPELEVLRNSLQRTLWLIVLAILGLALIFYSTALRLLERPLEHLVSAIRRLQEHPEERSVLDTPLPLAELDEIRQALNAYQERLSQVHRHLDRKNQELWTLAYHDGLTGCYNRRAFDEHWNALLGTIPGSRMAVSLVLFDCNHFKAINDTYGHQTGDLVLQALARVIQSNLRNGDNLYRVGGDEFILIMLDADEKAARNLAERVVDAVRAHDFTQLGIEEPVRISVGIASGIAEHPDHLQGLYWRADMAMYHAKRPGFRNVAVYRDDMKSESGSVFSSQTIATVTEAIETGRNLIMYYQPVYSLREGKVAYYEALVRIRGEQGMISPRDIFQIVESRRLDQEMDRAVFRKVLEDLDAGLIPAGTGVSVNVSGPSVTDPRLFDSLEPLLGLLDDYRIVLEVTETSLIRQIYDAGLSLDRLRDAGFLVALDDFGSGYSSLRYLSSMPVDVVKFDITLVRGLVDERQRQTQVIEGLVQLIRTAGYPVVAEGIEDEETLERVRGVGFEYVQGYHLGRPMPPEALTEAPCSGAAT